MQLTVTGKQVEIGDALRRRVETGLEAILAKYFKTAVEAHVVMAREAHLVRAEISLHVGRGIVVNAGAAAGDADGAFDAAAVHAAKRLRRHKRRLRDHHARLLEPRGPQEGGAPPSSDAEDAAASGGASGPSLAADAGAELEPSAVG
jgi:ribosomal subunit interface protein